MSISSLILGGSIPVHTIDNASWLEIITQQISDLGEQLYYVNGWKTLDVQLHSFATWQNLFLTDEAMTKVVYNEGARHDTHCSEITRCYDLTWTSEKTSDIWPTQNKWARTRVLLTQKCELVGISVTAIRSGARTPLEVKSCRVRILTNDEVRFYIKREEKFPRQTTLGYRILQQLIRIVEQSNRERETRQKKHQEIEERLKRRLTCFNFTSQG